MILIQHIFLYNVIIRILVKETYIFSKTQKKKNKLRHSCIEILFNLKNADATTQSNY